MTEATNRPTSIRIFLADGTPEGLRIVDKANWNGRALMCSRSQYSNLREREELGRTGVYVLKGPGETGFRPRLYIGEADVARTRINHHHVERDFWTHLILFTANDGSLNKAHVRYLEARLLELAVRSKRAELENVTSPVPPPLSEVDRADAEGFLEEMLLIFPLLGVLAFEPAVASKASASPRLHLRGKDTQAEGQDSAEGFLVFAGARCRADATPSFHKYLQDLRRELLDQELLVPQDGKLILTEDYLFSSPSTAASVALGRNANGRIEWKDAQAHTLKQLQEAALGDPQTDDDD